MPIKTLVTTFAAGALFAGASLALAGDPNAGKTRATAACASCHGLDGMGKNERWPNLAGQNEPYLVRQMQAFRDRIRKDALMSPMARPLSDRDIRNLAAYYSSLPRVPGTSSGADTAAGERRSESCIACHGPAGVSSNAEWPSLAGQKASYLAKQMRAFRSGVRIDPLMSPIMRQFSDQEIDDLATYYSSIRENSGAE